MQIYLARNNQQAGPYTLEQINQMLAAQQVLLTDLAWHQGMTEWKALGELTQGKNVYQPQGYAPEIPTFNPQPTHHIEVKKAELASIYKRTVAKIIDFALWIPFFAIPSFMLDETAKNKILEFQQTTFSAETQQQIFDLIPAQAWQTMAVYLLIMLAFQAFLLAKSGQSLGKRIMGIQIVDAQTYEKVGLTRVFLLRSIVFIILNFLSMPIITILDYAFAFGKKRQTLHDLVAKTKVINRQN
ncbi:RDD family protein [Acinetobacter sp. MD2(2019)]|uniref:RDD family protein n=1 Tax=Acinetobacter sp. MD2(2019) TaxID=2605273 RepID=UPI002D1E58F1|nr:RDD family protein [Acinetobacter sp. MD2(2019)]MEB3752913.1 RDD family protein [Acinetobacter sp. MD2(2019)]